LAEARIRKMEAEIRALQRQVFPGSSGDKLFAPEITPGQPTAPSNTSPTSTPVSDLLTRMDTVESQLARLTSQIEQTSNRLSILEARSAVGTADAAAATAATTPAPAGPAAADSNLSAMTGGASTPKPATVPLAAPAAKPAATPAPTSARPTPAPTAARPTAQRLAAVQAIQKPATNDPGDDEYSYGFRLWEAKFYPEAQQQLKLMVDKYPRHEKISYARNLLGRAYLDDGKPRDAATWFLQNFQADKAGARAPDSLLLLAESMRRLGDKNRACIALSEFASTYAAEAAGRLKSQYDTTRIPLKCS
jgi:TolA-binding protein